MLADVALTVTKDTKQPPRMDLTQTSAVAALTPGWVILTDNSRVHACVFLIPLSNLRKHQLQYKFI